MLAAISSNAVVERIDRSLEKSAGEQIALPNPANPSACRNLRRDNKPLR
jgi:hypothetical protein